MSFCFCKTDGFRNLAALRQPLTLLLLLLLLHHRASETLVGQLLARKIARYATAPLTAILAYTGSHSNGDNAVAIMMPHIMNICSVLTMGEDDHGNVAKWI